MAALILDNELLDDLKLAQINATLKVNGLPYVLDKIYQHPYTILLTAKSGYKFTDSKGSYDSDTGDFARFTLSSDKKTLSKTFPTGTNFDPYYWTFTSVVDSTPAPTYDWLIPQSFIDSLTAKKISMRVSGFPAMANQQVYYAFTVKMTVPDGYKFTEFVSTEYDTNAGDYLRYTMVSPNEITYTFSKGSPDIGWKYGTSLVNTSSKGFNDVFIIPQDKVKQLANTEWGRFVGTGQQSQWVTATSHIIGLIELPFIIPPSLISGSKEIKVGNSAPLGITADYISIDSYDFDMGLITVPSLKNNFLDYNQTSALLHLPYSNPIVIDIEYVIDQTIGINYIVNLYNGIASVNITSSKIGGVIVSKIIDLKLDIPYGDPDETPSRNDPNNIEMGIENGVLIPYIEILRNDAILENGFFTIPILDETVLSNQVGFIKVDEINLTTSAINNERSDIISLLQNGVIIK